MSYAQYLYRGKKNIIDVLLIMITKRRLVKLYLSRRVLTLALLWLTQKLVDAQSARETSPRFLSIIILRLERVIIVSWIHCLFILFCAALHGTAISSHKRIVSWILHYERKHWRSNIFKYSKERLEESW